MLGLRIRFAKQALALYLPRAPNVVHVWRSTTSRSLTGHVAHGTARSGNRRWLWLSGGTLLVAGATIAYAPRIHGDAAQTQLDALQLKRKDTDQRSLGELVRSYVVFTMCSVPALVDNAPQILQALSIPGFKWITEAFVRITFFDQFVGGDTAQQTIPLLVKLRAANKGALFAYSVEVDEAEATSSVSSNSKRKESPPHKRIVDEMVRCIDVAADFEDGVVGQSKSGRRTWVAVKITALLPDANTLTKLSKHILGSRPATIPFPGYSTSADLDVLYKPNPPSTFTQDDILHLKELHADLIRICTRAQERGVKIIIDAEYSWYQPALDALTLSLMRRFNKLPASQDKDLSGVQPLIYGTYQAYLRRTPSHLAHSIADAKANGYALGVKLVRGAYHPHEVAAYEAKIKGKPSLSISPDAQPPVWSVKSETDTCYDACVKVLVRAIGADIAHSAAVPSLGVLFGTHNWKSCDLILDELVRAGLAKKERQDDVVALPDEVTERLTVGQLYGMSDDLTNHLVNRTTSSTPFIIKYVPYGALSEVMPYLSRRAIENKSVLGGDGGAVHERRRAAEEIRRKLFGSWFSA